MARSVVFAPEAGADLIEVYDYIAARSSPNRALAYVERITAACMDMATFPDRGTRRDDVRGGLRVAPLLRRVTIAFHFDTETVTIDRILYGGRTFQGE